MQGRCIALTLAVALATIVGEVAGLKKELKEGQEIDKEMYQNLPNFEDKRVMNRIKCGACQASVLEIAHGVLHLENERNRPVKELEGPFRLQSVCPARDRADLLMTQVVEIMEKVCSQHMGEYGLLLDRETGNPTEQWSNDPSSLRAKGGYITRIAEGVCADVTNEHEEHIVKEAPKLCYVEGDSKKCQTKPLIVDVCGKKGFGWCKAEPGIKASAPVPPSKASEETPGAATEQQSEL